MPKAPKNKKTLTKKKKNVTNLFNYTSEQLKNALEAVRGGMTVLKSSKTFAVPRSTLRYKLSGARPETFGKVGPNCVLGDETENALCQWMKASCSKGFPITKDGLCYSVQKNLNETKQETPFTNNLPGRKWFEAFMTRHPELSVKRSEYISKARAAVTEEKIRQWFKNTLDDLGDQASILNDPKRVWNMDETSFYLNPSGGCVIAEKGKHVYATSSNSDKENITTLVAVNALGDYAPPLTMYKFERMPSSYFDSAPPHWGIGKSKNGWMTAESFLEYFVNVFHPFLLKSEYTFPVLVFLDGHSSHLSLQLSKFCRDNGIIIVCLYPNTTHILQPLDVAFFFPLKCQWKKALRTWRIDHGGMEIRKQDVPNLLNQILTTVSFKSTIVNGFRKCGLYPFNVENVDFGKCVNKTSSIVNELSQTENVSNIQIDFINFKQECLSYIEKKMDNAVIDEFKTCFEHNKKTEIAKAEMLFDVWLNIKSDIENETHQQEIETLPVLCENVIDFPFPECEHVTAENSLLVRNDELINSSILRNLENLFQQNDSSEQRQKIEMDKNVNDDKQNVSSKDKEIQPKHCDINLNLNSNLESEKENILSQTKSCDKETKKINILSNILVIPETNINPAKKKKAYNSSVLTSAGWIENEEKKKQMKLIDVKRKEENKKKRIENKQKRIELQKMKKPRIIKTKKRLVNSKHCKNKAIEIATVDVEAENELGNDNDDTNKEFEENKNSEFNNEENLKSKPENKIHYKLDTALTENLYVIVKFEHNFYPGKITKICDEEYTISTMTRALNNWKWPYQKDEITYKKDEIIQIINEPIKINSRGVFSVPEMD